MMAAACEGKYIVDALSLLVNGCEQNPHLCRMQVSPKTASADKIAFKNSSQPPIGKPRPVQLVVRHSHLSE